MNIQSTAAGASVRNDAISVRLNWALKQNKDGGRLPYARLYPVTLLVLHFLGQCAQIWDLSPAKRVPSPELDRHEDHKVIRDPSAAGGVDVQGLRARDTIQTSTCRTTLFLRCT